MNIGKGIIKSIQFLVCFFFLVFFPSFCHAEVSINDFKKDYFSFLQYFPAITSVRQLGRNTLIAEFDSANKIFAGHLGSFWAWPFYSTQADSTFRSNPSRYKDGFASGLLFYDRDGGIFFPEDEYLETTGTWYPSKLVVENKFSKNGKTFTVKGVKIASPFGYLGFALKVNVTNTGSNVLNLNLLQLSFLNNINVGNRYHYFTNWSDPAVANFQTAAFQGKIVNKGGFLQYQNTSFETNMINGNNSEYFALQNTNNNLGNINGVYLTFGANLPFATYQIQKRYGGDIVSQYKNHGGRLINGGSGTEGAMTYELTLAPGASQTLIFYYLLSTNEARGIASFSYLRGKDPEADADSYWNAKIKDAFSRLPSLKTKDPVINEIYKNSVMSGLYNLIDFNSAVGSDGQSFITGDAYPVSFTWAFVNQPVLTSMLGGFDSSLTKKTIKNLLMLNYNSSSAYNPVIKTKWDLSNYPNNRNIKYSYDPYSLITLIHSYIVTTGDRAFLDEQVLGKVNVETIRSKTIRDWLTVLQLVQEGNYYDPLDHVSKCNPSLVDYGGDLNLFEAFINNGAPKLSGWYTGFVVSPNAERISSMIKTRELIGSNVFNSERCVEQVKSQVNFLWNSQSGWFDCLSLYNPDNWGIQSKKTSAERKEAIFISAANLLEFPDVIDQTKKTMMVNKIMNKFLGSFGFYSVSKDYQSFWGERQDWHGSGVYVGESGNLLSNLFARNESEKAYQILKKMNYLSFVPYFSQCQSADTPRFVSNQGGCPASIYFEGLSYAEGFVKGLFGFSPHKEYFELHPQFPDDLLSTNASLSNLRFQDQTYDVEVGKTFELTITNLGFNKWKIMIGNNRSYKIRNGTTI